MSLGLQSPHSCVDTLATFLRLGISREIEQLDKMNAPDPAHLPSAPCSLQKRLSEGPDWGVAAL